MKAFIFTAGYGERLKPVTDIIPKPLVPVLNRPAIEWPLAMLKRAGVNEVICNLHHLGNVIEEYFAHHASYEFNVKFSGETTILGTGGGLKKCERFLSDDDFLVLNGDVIMDLDIAALLDFHAQKKSRATVVLYPHSQSALIGPVGVRGERVADFKNFLGTGLDSGFVYTGAAVLSPEIFNYLVPEFSSIVYTAYIEFIMQDALNYFVHRGYWYDIGTARALFDANMELLRQKDAVVHLFASLGVDINPISPRAIVHHDAIVEDSVIGDCARVGGSAHVRCSVVLPDSQIAAGEIVYDALVYGEKNLLRKT